MSTLSPIIELGATHYDFVSKTWVPGTFRLHATHIRFQGEKNESDGSYKNLRISFNSISGIERKQSNLIYPALVITSGHEKYWFASFPNRDSVFNVVELFWKQPLLPNPPSSVPQPADSAFGKELLGILHESENNLTEAAAALSSQGKQLRETEAVLSDVNVELTKAQKFMRSMTFLGFVSTAFSSRPRVSDKCDEEHFQKHFRVIYTLDKSSSRGWEAGTVVVSGDSLTLLDVHRCHKITVRKEDVGKISVLSLWELCIVHRSTQCCHLMCSQLKVLVKFLSSSLRIKIIQDTSDSTNASSSSLPSVEEASTKGELIQDLRVCNAGQQQQQVVSEQDMDEISSLLTNLQAIASDVCREQTDQMTRIQTLLTDVETTELRIRAQDKEIKELM